MQAWKFRLNPLSKEKNVEGRGGEGKVGGGNGEEGPPHALFISTFRGRGTPPFFQEIKNKSTD